jgi:Uncharacterized conserved protein involved in intracellular sulfur reduction
MDFLIILDAGPVTTERTENALQFALAMTRRDDVNVRVFVMGDAVVVARADPGAVDRADGAARTLRSLVMSGAELAVCDASLASRQIANDELIVGATASPMSLLADWALAADRVLAF